MADRKNGQIERSGTAPSTSDPKEGKAPRNKMGSQIKVRFPSSLASNLILTLALTLALALALTLALALALIPTPSTHVGLVLVADLDARRERRAQRRLQAAGRTA